MRGDRVRSVRWVAATLLGATLLVGCTTANGATNSTNSHNQAVHAQRAKPVTRPVTITSQPAVGTPAASPSGIIATSVSDGTITTVALTSSTGTVVTGQLSQDKHTWTATEHLGYGTTYTWSGAAVGMDGKTAPIAGSFTTVTPARQISGRLNVGDNQTYGIAIPVALTFSSPVSDEAAVERALTVTTSVPSRRTRRPTGWS